jgi:hypothetical protein
MIRRACRSLAGLRFVLLSSSIMIVALMIAQGFAERATANPPQCPTGIWGDCPAFCNIRITEDYTACSSVNWPNPTLCCQYTYEHFQCYGLGCTCAAATYVRSTLTGTYPIPPYHCDGSPGVGRCVR